MDDDERTANVISGEWQGDWGMWYEDEIGRIHYATDTYIKFIPDYSGATHGYGYQEDYYSRGRYRYLWYKFNWSVKDGILYLSYPYDPELDTYIRDYKLSNDYFVGYFDESNSRFRMSKLVDYYEWTPEFYSESSYYGWSVWSEYSNKYDGGVQSKSYNQELPKIVKRGRMTTRP